MYLHIYFHNFSKIHYLEKYEWTIYDDKFISNDDDEPIIVSYDAEYELEKTIIYQEKYHWKKDIGYDTGRIVAEIFQVY
jgi:hypothetical protein